MSTLKQEYKTAIIPELKKQFSYKHAMQVPALKKIIISMGIAEATKDKNAMEDCVQELTMLSGQKPVFTRARQSISNFKLRKGSPIGLKVTLRNQRMFDFLYRFIHIVCPRIRDFRGLPIQLDGRGNYSLGLKDQHCFPEINLDKVKHNQGMNITFVTSAKSDEEAFSLLKEFGLPFKKKKSGQSK